MLNDHLRVKVEWKRRTEKS